jgi:hypothetical protein
MFSEFQEYESAKIKTENYVLELSVTSEMDKSVNSKKIGRKMYHTYNFGISTKKLNIKKNNINLDSHDEVNVWYIVEKLNLGKQPDFFTSNNIKKLLYKKYSHEKYDNISGYFFIQDNYSSLESWDKKIEKINWLSHFYDCNRVNIPIKIIKSENYEEIEFYLRVKQTNSDSIFDQHKESNYYDFLNSTYENYGLCNFNESESKVNELIDYYIGYRNEYSVERKTLVAAIFMEILKDQYSTTGTFEKKLISSFNELGLIPEKFTRILLNYVYEKLDKIEEELINQMPSENVKIVNIINKIKESYLFKHIVWYRNKNAHEGILSFWESEVWEEIAKKSFNDVTNGILNVNPNLSPEKKIYNMMKRDFTSFYDDITVNKFREKVLEFFNCLLPLILFRILDVDCMLSLDIPVNDSKKIMDILRNKLNLNTEEILRKDLGRYNKQISKLYELLEDEPEFIPKLPEKWHSDFCFNTKNNLNHFLV